MYALPDGAEEERSGRAGRTPLSLVYPFLQAVERKKSLFQTVPAIRSWG